MNQADTFTSGTGLQLWQLIYEVIKGVVDTEASTRSDSGKVWEKSEVLAWLAFGQ